MGPRTTSPIAQTFRHAGSAMLVDLNEAALIELYTGAFGKQPLREGLASDRDHELVDLKPVLALSIVYTTSTAPPAAAALCTLAPSLMSSPCFLKCPQGLFCDGPVRYRQELFQRLEHRHLAVEPPPNAAELEADDTGSDHAEACGHCINSKAFHESTMYLPSCARS